ncbi:MAG: RNA polymerase sigma factor [Clostridia bacterium]|nr:RNA polymerase sigma factor [Clostridia bacterium]
MEDETLIRLFLERKEDAVLRTAEKYGRRLRSLAYGITKDRQTAEECENDTYLEAWNRIPPAEPKNYFYAFLARIVRGISIDRCRAQASLKRSALIVELTEELDSCLPAGETAEELLDAKLLGEAVSRFLRTQTAEKQVIFLRRYFYLDSVKEISGRLSIGESKVKMVLSRLRRDLREYLEKEGYTP